MLILLMFLYRSSTCLLVTTGFLFLISNTYADCPLKWGFYNDRVIPENERGDVVRIYRNSEYFSESHCSTSQKRKKIGEKLRLNCRKPHGLTEKICKSRDTINNCNKNIITNCDLSSPYRTINGSCNNKNNPHWGTTNTCFQRYLPANYSDGMSAPRVSSSGKPLESARTVSTRVHGDIRSVSPKLTLIFMQLGQYFAHDILISLHADAKNCCENPNSSPECFPIYVSSDDSFYSKHGVKCLEFTRTPRCPLCSEGARIQMNEQTTFLDGSVIYGCTDDVANQLWNETDGTLHSVKTDFGELPTGISEVLDCKEKDGKKCFLTGDLRADAFPSLTAFHVFNLRYHNVLARKLKEVNPHWDGVRLYQEARKIYGAEIQMIAYGHYLPLVLGKCLMDIWDLNVLEKGYTEYDDQLDPSIFVDFATGAMRFGHSTIPSVFPQYWDDGVNNSFCLRNFFNYPFKMYEGQLDPLLKGMASARQENVDPALVEDVNGYFNVFLENDKYGKDLAAISIQRARDRGLARYIDYLRYIFNVKIRDFSDLRRFIPQKRINDLKTAYKYVEDIGFYTGFLSEYHVSDGIVGPSVAYLIGEQFHRIKFGDRFYFEHSGVFNEDQLNEIRTKTSISAFLCLTTNIDSIQKNALLTPDPITNPIVKCSEITGIDLNFWKEKV